MNKNKLREQAKQIRASIPVVQRGNDASLLKKNIEKIVSDNNQIIGTYYPIGTEIYPPHSLFHCQMALPVVRDRATLEFYPWSSDMRTIKRDFDIPIPDTRGLMPIIPNVILLPLLLCDVYGNRIGYGAGHYDRYIASLTTPPKLIGVCFDEQVYDSKIPAEEHDIPLDLIVTPKRIIEKA